MRIKHISAWRIKKLSFGWELHKPARTLHVWVGPVAICISYTLKDDYKWFHNKEQSQ